MKSTCVLPPLSDIFYDNQQQQKKRNSVFNVSNLLSPSSSSSSSEEEEEEEEPTVIVIKAKRKRASPSQLSVLNQVFQSTIFPSTELRMELGKQLGMSPRTVQIWFQNKRQSIRTRRSTPPISSPYLLPPLIRLPQPQQQSSSWLPF